MAEPEVVQQEEVSEPAQVFITQEPEAQPEAELVLPGVVESNIANVESEGEISEEEIVMRQSPQEDAGDAISSSPKEGLKWVRVLF